ncbi:hypothetical protein VTN00DRAFT_9004 [Thermoascus crustaceus]|uniref:uncharacterized protein n=1 Tax=Thermoascus crustaceus TaxID=5088 RepID=UPI0037435B2E
MSLPVQQWTRRLHQGLTAKRRKRLQDAEEAYLAFHLLIHDLDNFLEEISRTWAGYRQGKFDLVAASVMTNAAIDIARRMEEDLQPILANHGGPEIMLEVLFWRPCEAKYGKDQVLQKQRPETIFPKANPGSSERTDQALAEDELIRGLRAMFEKRVKFPSGLPSPPKSS